MVARVRSFTKSARYLKTTPVAVLNRINKLEKYFGVKIFRRGVRGVELTEEGKKNRENG
jgi:DNA-binding transcriptional LysR family regulator